MVSQSCCHAVGQSVIGSVGQSDNRISNRKGQSCGPLTMWFAFLASDSFWNYNSKLRIWWSGLELGQSPRRTGARGSAQSNRFRGNLRSKSSPSGCCSRRLCGPNEHPGSIGLTLSMTLSWHCRWCCWPHPRIRAPTTNAPWGSRESCNEGRNLARNNSSLVK